MGRDDDGPAVAEKVARRAIGRASAAAKKASRFMLASERGAAVREDPCGPVHERAVRARLAKIGRRSRMMRSIGWGRRNALQPDRPLNALHQVERGALDRRARETDVGHDRGASASRALEHLGGALDPEPGGLDRDRRLAEPRRLMRIAAAARRAGDAREGHEQGFHAPSLDGQERQAPPEKSGSR